jgi:hypothetical protein
MIAVEVAGYLSWMCVVGVLHAWANPNWADWNYSANLILLFWYQIPYMM